MIGSTFAPPQFIHSRGFDLVWFSIGWIPVLVAFVLANERPQFNLGAPTVLDSVAGRGILLFILVVNFAHRHITFPLVYGDPAVFRARQRRYVALPIGFAAVTLAAAWVALPPRVEGDIAFAGARAPAATTSAHVVTLFLAREGATVADENMRRAVPSFVKHSVEIAAASRLEDVAAALSDAAGDALVVEVEDRRLVFRAPFSFGATPRTQWFSVRAGRAAQAELGLTPITDARRHSASRPLLAWLTALSLLWTIYHTLMQKMGILRIYARLAGAGSARLDRVYVFLWFAALVAHLAARDDVRATAARASSVGRMVRPAFDVVAPLLAVAQWALLGAALVVTVMWLRRDIRDRGRLHFARTVFALSLLALYATFAYDLVIGFATLAFSHSLEYIAFVTVFTAKKYAPVSDETLPWIGKMARHPFRSALLFAAFTTCVFGLARTQSREWLDLYIVGSSFLHFLYDGWLWKVRKPEVQTPLAIASSD